jgi:hypothetical protein
LIFALLLESGKLFCPFGPEMLVYLGDDGDDLALLPILAFPLFFGLLGHLGKAEKRLHDMN